MSLPAIMPERAEGYLAPVINLRLNEPLEAANREPAAAIEGILKPAVELQLVPDRPAQRARLTRPLATVAIAPSLRQSVFPHPLDLSS